MKRIRHGNTESILQTALPEIQWKNHRSAKRRARLDEPMKQNGNFRGTSLAIKSGETAAGVQGGHESVSSAQPVKTRDAINRTTRNPVLVTAFIMLSAYVASLLAIAPRLSSYNHTPSGADHRRWA